MKVNDKEHQNLMSIILTFGMFQKELKKSNSVSPFTQETAKWYKRLNRGVMELEKTLNNLWKKL